MIKAEVFSPYEVPIRVFSSFLSSVSSNGSCCEATPNIVPFVPATEMCSQGFALPLDRAGCTTSLNVVVYVAKIVDVEDVDDQIIYSPTQVGCL